MYCVRPPYRVQQKCVSSLGRSHTDIKYALPGNKTDYQGTVARQTSNNKVTAAPAQLAHNENRRT